MVYEVTKPSSHRMTKTSAIEYNMIVPSVCEDAGAMLARTMTSGLTLAMQIGIKRFPHVLTHPFDEFSENQHNSLLANHYLRHRSRPLFVGARW